MTIFLTLMGIVTIGFTIFIIGVFKNNKYEKTKDQEYQDYKNRYQ